MAIKKIIEFVVKSDSAKKDIDGLNKSIKDNEKLETKSVQSSKDMGKSYRDAGKGARVASAGVKVFGTALKATGIGLVVSLVVKLSQALMKNQVIMDAVTDVMRIIEGVIQGVVNGLVDTYQSLRNTSGSFEKLQKVGKALFTIFLTPFKLYFYSIQSVVWKAVLQIQKALNTLGVVSDDAVKKTEDRLKKSTDAIKETVREAGEAAITVKDNAKDAFKEVGDAAKQAYGNIKENVDGIHDLAKAMNDLETDIEIMGAKEAARIMKLRNENEELKRMRDDESLSYEERIKASERYSENLDEINALNIQQAQRELDLAEMALSQNKSNEKLQKAKIEAENRLLEVQLSVEKEQTRLFRKHQGLRKQQVKETQDLNDMLSNHTDERIKEADALYEETVERINKTIENEEEKERLIALAGEQRKATMAEIKAEEEQNIRDISMAYMEGIELQRLEEEKKHEEAKQRILDEVKNEEERNRLLELEEQRHSDAMADVKLKAEERIKQIMREVHGDEVDETFEEKLEREKMEALQELELLGATEEQKFQLMKSYDDKLAQHKEKLAEEEKERNKQVAMNQVTLGLRALGALSGAMDEQSQLSKGIAMAETAWSTYSGIMTAMKDTEMPWFNRIANSLIVGAMGAKNIKQIASTNVKKGGGGGSSVAGGGRGMSSPNFNVIGDARQQALDEVESEREEQPIKTYVVAGDVSTAQELERNRIKNSRFL